MRASESFRAFFACVGFWFFMAMLIFGYLARPTETTSSGLHIGASELRAAGIYAAAGIHWLGRESKMLFNRRNKKSCCSKDTKSGPNDHFPFAFRLSPTRRRMALNDRTHRLKPRRGESECRLSLFASALDPSITTYTAQQHFTGRNG